MLKHQMKFAVLAVMTAVVALAILKTPPPQKRELIILTYHHLDSTADNADTVTPTTFERHIRTLLKLGYTPVSMADVIAFADGEKGLPKKPICIVFDDGYSSNLTLAAPILEKYGVPAEICIIGSSVGKQSYKDSERPIIPHFSWAEARAASETGLIHFGSHTYAMHDYVPYESGRYREFAAKAAWETDAEFESAFFADCKAMDALMKTHLGYEPTVFAYPHGVTSTMTEAILEQHGIRVTLTTDAHVNTIYSGDTDRLYLLGRFTVCEDTDIEAILNSNTQKSQGASK